MALIFPVDGEDLAGAFNRAIELGVMQREHPALATFWAQHEYLAHDTEAGVDVFYCKLSGLHVMVPRTEEST